MSEMIHLVGSKIRKLRKINDLTQEELAEKCQLQNTFIAGIERGERNITLKTLEKIAIGLDVTPTELFIVDDLQLGDEYHTKKNEIDLIRSILFTRDTNEIKLIKRITEDILKTMDTKNARH